MGLCRFCMSHAVEFICLDCKSKFERLEKDNADLRKQVEFLTQRDRARNRGLAASIKRKMRPK